MKKYQEKEKKYMGMTLKDEIKVLNRKKYKGYGRPRNEDYNLESLFNLQLEQNHFKGAGN